MEDLFKQAEREGKWFHCDYQDLWFSPADLRAEQAAGRFRWGAVNWRLRDPSELVDAALRRARLAVDEYHGTCRRVGVPPRGL